MKRILEREKQNIRHVRTHIAKEIKQKSELEKVLRQCVDDVKNEIIKKKNDNKSIYCKFSHLLISKVARGIKGQQELKDERNLSNKERSKIIEVLLS
jgi:sugar-specific transcriptional regulator TrmB